MLACPCIQQFNVLRVVLYAPEHGIIICAIASQVKSRDQLSSPRVAAQKVEGASGNARGRGGECPRRGSPPVL